MKKQYPFIPLLFIIVFSASFLASCISVKKVNYFNNLPDSSVIPLETLPIPEQIIQVNDVLEVRVGGENEKTVQYLNQYMGTGIAQYMVNIKGEIELPKIGTVQVIGLTIEQAKKKITDAYAVYLKDPVVTMKAATFKFTILGAIRAPGNYAVLNEKINVFEAIAQGGDMMPYARRDNVRIIRDVNGKREVLTLNFNDKEILNSDDYYLKRNDIVYITSLRAQLESENFTKTAAIIGTATGLLGIILALIRIK